MGSDGQAAQSGDAAHPRKWLVRLERLYSGSVVVFWPFTDLATRVFVALPYLKSGIVKAADWDKALLLASEEYPVSWMAANPAAATGLAIELIAPALLLLGLFTRPAAMMLAALTIVAQLVYIPTTTNLMLIAMLVWFVANGPAAISLDAIWTRKTALAQTRPVAAMIRIGAILRRRIAPLVILAMRVWLGISLLALAEIFEPSVMLATWLPTTSFSGLPGWIAVLFAVLLISGTAASPVSYALVLVVAAFMIAGVHPDVTFYPVLLLGVYEARGAGPLSVDGAFGRFLRNRFGSSHGRALCPDDPEVWLATLKDWRRGGKDIAGSLLARSQGDPDVLAGD